MKVKINIKMPEKYTAGHLVHFFNIAEARSAENFNIKFSNELSLHIPQGTSAIDIVNIIKAIPQDLEVRTPYSWERSFVFVYDDGVEEVSDVPSSADNDGV